MIFLPSDAIEASALLLSQSKASLNHWIDILSSVAQFDELAAMAIEDHGDIFDCIEDVKLQAKSDVMIIEAHLASRMIVH